MQLTFDSVDPLIGKRVRFKLSHEDEEHLTGVILEKIYRQETPLYKIKVDPPSTTTWYVQAELVEEEV